MFDYHFHDHVHSHNVSGRIEHSLKPGTGEEIRGFKVDQAEALDLSATMINWLDEVWSKDFFPKTAELRKVLAQRFQKKLNDIREKREADRQEKISELEKEIEKLKAEGKYFWSSEYRQQEAINALGRKIDRLIYEKSDPWRYYSYWDVAPSEIPGACDAVTKIRAEVSDIYVIAEMTVEKELMLSPAAIAVLYGLRTGGTKASLLSKFESDYNWAKNLVDNDEEFMKQYGCYFKEEFV